MFSRICHHCPSRSTGSRNRNDWSDSRLCHSTWLPILLHNHHHFRRRNDISSCAKVWKEESFDLSFNMQHSRINQYHGNQSFWNSSQANIGRQKPIYSCINLCLLDSSCSLHPHTNELLQQSSLSIQHKHVSSPFPISTQTKWPTLTIYSVNPLYYVTFTTATLCASFIMFKGFNTAGAVNTISLLSGFLVIFSGVYLLNLSRKDPVGDTLLGSAQPGRHGGFEDMAIPTDSMTGFATRRSMQARRSSDFGRHSRQASWSSVGNGGVRGSAGNDREALMHEYSLHELAEDSDEEGKSIKVDEESGLANVRGPPRLSGSGRARVDGRDNKNSSTTNLRVVDRWWRGEIIRDVCLRSFVAVLFVLW